MSDNTHALLVFEGDVPGAALHGFGLGLDAAEALSMAFEESALGASWVHLRIPTARLLRPESAPPILAWLRRWLVAGVRQGAGVGFVTCYANATEASYLEASLLEPLLAERPLPADACWDWVALPASSPPPTPGWRPTESAPGGGLFHRPHTADLWLS